MKRIFLEIVGGLFVIWNFGGFGYLLVVTYLLLRFLFLKFRRENDDLIVELVFLGVLLFHGSFILGLFYNGGYVKWVYVFYLLLFLVTILLKGKK